MSEKAPIIAFTYPGQGSSKPRMAVSIISPESEAYGVFDRATNILADHGHDVNLKDLCFYQDDPIVGQLHNQLAIFTTAYAAELQLREQVGVRPDYVAGHSIGEFAAYTGALVLGFEYALPLVAERAISMEEAGRQASEKGGIAVITGIAPEIVESIAHNNGAQVGNYNNPLQTTVTGTGTQLNTIETDVEKIKQDSGDRRIRFIPLPDVNVAVHSRWLQYAADRLRGYIDPSKFATPYNTEVILNINGQTAKSPMQIAQLAPDQLTNPVRWMQSMDVITGARDHEGQPQEIDENQRVIIVEVGYGTVLTGINKYLQSERVKVVKYETALSTGLAWEDLAA